jgi:hypothetical protein
MLTVFVGLSFVTSFFTFDAGAVGTHSAILSAVGTLFGLSSWFMSQAITKTEGLFDVRLGSIQTELFHAKIERRKARLFLKFGLGFGGALLAIICGQLLNLFPERWMAGIAYSCLVLSAINFALIMTEYFSMSRLLRDLTKDADQREARKQFGKRSDQLASEKHQPSAAD